MASGMALGAWLTVFFLLGASVWHLQAGHLMLVIYLGASGIAYTIYALLRRCPACHMPVLLKPLRFLGIVLYTWTFIVPEKCRHCGERLK